MRQWVIRDKDRNLKALLRRQERANSAARIAAAMEEFRRALAAHALLPKHARSSWVRQDAPADHTTLQNTTRKGHERQGPGGPLIATPKGSPSPIRPVR